jgi:hypothetical protein
MTRTSILQWWRVIGKPRDRRQPVLGGLVNEYRLAA